MIDYLKFNSEYCVAHNRRAGSTSLCKLLMLCGGQLFQPLDAPPVNWHSLASSIRVTEPEGLILLAVREPQERFLRACAKTGETDIDAVLARLEATPETEWNIHFLRQSSYVKSATQLFRFPDQLGDLADILGMGNLIEDVQPIENPPTTSGLTKKQKHRLQAIYAADFRLYVKAKEGDRPIIEPKDV